MHGWYINDFEYETGLRNYVDILKQLSRGAKLIWGSTTPDIRKIECPGEEKNSAIIRRNAIAEKVMKHTGTVINMLYELTYGKNELFYDGIHYTDTGYEILGSV